MFNKVKIDEEAFLAEYIPEGVSAKVPATWLQEKLRRLLKAERAVESLEKQNARLQGRIEALEERVEGYKVVSEFNDIKYELDVRC